MAVQSDTSYVKNPREIRDNLDRIYKELAQGVEAADKAANRS
jgi:hypothetical protein